MSTIWKVGTFGICMAFSAYRIGLGLRDSDARHFAVLVLIFVICAGAFLRTIFSLHRAMLRAKEPLKDDAGRTMFP